MRTAMAILSLLFFLPVAARGGEPLPQSTLPPEAPASTLCDCATTGVCVCAECKCRPSGTAFEFSDLDVKAPSGYTLDCNGKTCRLVPNSQLVSNAYTSTISAPAPAVVSASVVTPYSGAAAYSTAARQPVRGLFKSRPLRRIFGGFRGGCGK